MNIDDLAALMDKTKEEVVEILNNNEIIELKLNDKKSKEMKEKGNLEIIK